MKTKRKKKITSLSWLLSDNWKGDERLCNETFLRNPLSHFVSSWSDVMTTKANKASILNEILAQTKITLDIWTKIVEADKEFSTIATRFNGILLTCQDFKISSFIFPLNIYLHSMSTFYYLCNLLLPFWIITRYHQHKVASKASARNPL